MYTSDLQLTDFRSSTLLKVFRSIRPLKPAAALRDGFADVLRGLHIREEVNDFAGGAALPAITPGRAAISRIHSRGAPRPRRQFTMAGNAAAHPRAAFIVARVRNHRI